MLWSAGTPRTVGHETAIPFTKPACAGFFFAPTMIKHFPANTKGRDFVVGDLHGHPEMLCELLTAVCFDAEVDRVFSVGDLIDRGPDSQGALAFLDEPWFHAVRGNHEDMLLLAVRSKLPMDRQLWEENGGIWARSCTSEELAEYAAKIEALPHVITVGEGATRFNVLHAEFIGTDAELDDGKYDHHTQMRLLWGRSLASGHLFGHQQGLSTTYVGHNIVAEVATAASHVFIDTGAFLPDGGLSMVEPMHCRVWRAEREQPLPASQAGLLRGVN